ncbi:DUF2809 domain-containing protein [Turicibacter sanguinis]|uniref:ribosomal maturation YjgA family protein n=1 Tax=Turicibacter sanguinis TaxID=154288 RepID=UPI0012B9683E|nr:DUF2809 domain-containing protein [Turicibacter sanguinis]MCU7197512.1 DUF2809 domain-containing protein [Turicibacter sanguinis]MDB8566053.1 DUF2809 domain-containing protein [Turicibacter sanguinis]MDB8568729.1 DUF2809 domain-containing protein [Turicibacter sanguinis]MDB8571478.1 DUF2809 domain-containing protein [Turicibacter sanguinis]MDB8580313.1 DUF2809 domain-containing protein [Turicibacter sanguinis]
MKKRRIYFFMVVLTIGLGLASRKFIFVFPDSIAPYIGDTLWAMMVYFGFQFLPPNGTLIKSLLLAFIFSYLIEFSQLYQADWINQIRASTLGGLVLGYGFLIQDLVSYAIGILIGFCLDYHLYY